MEVATPQAWRKNPELVLRFYNDRRSALRDAEPNAAHKALAALEDCFDVDVITQNVDDLHERGGSSRVLHLHGELTKARSSEDQSYVQSIGYDPISLGDCCPVGAQLRPHIVWFGEAVPLIEDAARLVSAAEIVVVVGSSLVVYPAAGLLYYVSPQTPIYLVDPLRPEVPEMANLTWIQSSAAKGVPELCEALRQQ